MPNLNPAQKLNRTLILVPIWLLSLVIQKFLPEDHPWKHQSLTLKSWYARATPFSVQLSIMYWAQLFYLASVLYLLW